MHDLIIETENVSKLYGARREEAMELLRQGAEKDEVLKKTGVTTALYDINLQIPRARFSSSSDCPGRASPPWCAASTACTGPPPAPSILTGWI